jgi:Holliday junction DNA helicase RuvA
MLHYIKGFLVEVNPTTAIVECNGLGYEINISLNTYSAISGLKELQLFLHPIYKEDSQTLYGFYSKKECSIFQQLISVSGVGGNTARTILSSLSPAEVIGGVSREDVIMLQSVKGIGLKTAQRIIIDLKDKLIKLHDDELSLPQAFGIKTEAIAALEVLGYNARQSERVLNTILKQSPDFTIEELIKAALKKL